MRTATATKIAPSAPLSVEYSVAYTITATISNREIAAAAVAVGAATATIPTGLGAADLAIALEGLGGNLVACYGADDGLSILATGVATDSTWRAWEDTLAALAEVITVNGECLDDCGLAWTFGAATVATHGHELATLLDDPARWAALAATH